MADKPKLVIVGGDKKEEEPVKEETKVPTLAVEAMKVLHPMFTHPQTGQPVPPPPDHELRVGIQLSITTKGRLVIEGPGLIFVSGDSPEEIADVIRKIVLEGLQHVIAENATVQVAPESALNVLDRFGEKT